MVFSGKDKELKNLSAKRLSTYETQDQVPWEQLEKEWLTLKLMKKFVKHGQLIDERRLWFSGRRELFEQTLTCGVINNSLI